jgi:hypothetical protein
MAKLTVERLLTLADEAREEINAGKLSLKSELYISLEVCKDDDEDTFQNRVHGGTVIEVGVTKRLHDDSYVHIQLNGEPNFNAYPEK